MLLLLLFNVSVGDYVEILIEKDPNFSPFCLKFQIVHLFA